MSVVICTLFEGHYHEGVAVLTNSLYNNGFRGDIFVGYRGPLTSWAGFAKDNPAILWEGAKTLTVASDLNLHFLPVDTHYHFTTYKPTFMLKLINGIAKDASGIAYFDPDIVVKCQWSFYEEWLSYGVGLVQEIVSQIMPPTHPTRQMWRRLIEKSGRTVTNDLYAYINGGFCGVSKAHIEFIETWRDIIDTAIKYYNFDPQIFIIRDKTVIFCGDQDGLNIAAMCTTSPISEVGPQEMDFLHSGFIMSHANTYPKPWKKLYLLCALKGITPSLQDYTFWNNTTGPIQYYSTAKIQKKLLSIKIASFVGRFYTKKSF